MTKSDALALFGGNKAALGRALGMTGSAVCQWPEKLPIARRDHIVGAAYRLGLLSDSWALALLRGAG